MEQIIALYIGFSKQYIEKNFVSEIMGHRSEIEHKEFKDTLESIEMNKIAPSAVLKDAASQLIRKWTTRAYCNKTPQRRTALEESNCIIIDEINNSA